MADLRIIDALARPLADGDGVADWRTRAAALGALARPGDPEAVPRVGYDFAYGLLAEPDRAVFGRLFHQVESIERLAISAVAHALCRLAPPEPVARALCGVLYDEARHLEALTTLQGLEPCVTPWIAAKREPFWRLLRDADDLVAFVWFQHCLSEVEGSIAAAEKLRQLEDAGAAPAALRVAHQIFAEETEHARTGYAMLGQLDRAVPAAALRALIARYLVVEPLGDAATRKGKRQRASLAIAERYLVARDVAEARAAILQAAQAARGD